MKKNVIKDYWRFGVLYALIFESTPERDRVIQLALASYQVITNERIVIAKSQLSFIIATNFQGLRKQIAFLT